MVCMPFKSGKHSTYDDDDDDDGWPAVQIWCALNLRDQPVLQTVAVHGKTDAGQVLQPLDKRRQLIEISLLCPESALVLPELHHMIMMMVMMVMMMIMIMMSCLKSITSLIARNWPGGQQLFTCKLKFEDIWGRGDVLTYHTCWVSCIDDVVAI